MNSKTIRFILSFGLAVVLLGATIWQSPTIAQAQAGTELVFNIADGNITITSDNVEQIGRPDTPYTAADSIVITGTANRQGNGLTIRTSHPVTLRDFTFTATQFTAVDITNTRAIIILEGVNTVTSGSGMGGGRAGIYVSATASLTIRGSGSLIANGHGNSAGIGGHDEVGSTYGDCGAIVIESGTVTANGKGTGAGIGTASGWTGSGPTVIIKGGNVTASSESGPAIGGQAGQNAGSLTMEGGTLYMSSTGFGPAGTGTFTVNGGSVTVQGQTAPSITSVSPGIGPTSGSTDITLIGTNLTGVTDVKICGTAATNVSVVDSSTITCTTPAGTAGAADVSVLNPGTGADTLVGGFVYSDIAVPIIAVQGGSTEIPHSGSLTLEVANASGYNNPVYQWHKDNVVIPSATNATLTTTEAGSYKVAVTADSQTKESAPVNLSVVDSTSGSDDSGGDGSSDDQDRDKFTLQTLTDPATGITVTGYFTPGTTLTVTEKALHAKGTCAACDEIRSTGGWVALYDVSITGQHSGNIELRLPVDSSYNGQSMTVWHCKRGHVEKLSGTAENGVVAITVSSLSPFAVFTAGNHNPSTGGLPDDAAVDVPQTGDNSNMGGWIALLTVSLLMMGLAVWQLLKRRGAARR